MRFVKLTEAELITLQEGHKKGLNFQFRNRCQCLVFSHQGRTVSELAEFFEVSKITIYGWFDRWEKSGICGVMVNSSRGLDKRKRLNISNLFLLQRKCL